MILTTFQLYLHQIGVIWSFQCFLSFIATSEMTEEVPEEEEEETTVSGEEGQGSSESREVGWEELFGVQKTYSRFFY